MKTTANTQTFGEALNLGTTQVKITANTQTFGEALNLGISQAKITVVDLHQIFSVFQC